MDTYCEKCGKTMDEGQFYTYKDGTKTEMCKKCLTMHIDNFNEETFLWLLQKMDVPYVPEEWNVLRDRAYAKNPNLNGMSVFGKYLSKMKLKQWKEYGWEDSERLQALNEEKNRAHMAEKAERDAMFKEQFENGEISESQYKTLVSTESQNKNILAQNPAAIFGMENNPFNENNFMQLANEENDLTAELTDEDKKYLLMK